ncbi:hypothetical protein NDU88_007496 [Pleurodeles waltl]|uniref:Uncharacterized protein n=1 Tax=Pleurodeles waltl TaxID=8319 RepID=A0AAV7VUM5_PLEWA|nr:hypothetical protein NDU88_007496 [Pleurodeles waltl]
MIAGCSPPHVSLTSGGRALPPLGKRHPQQQRPLVCLRCTMRSARSRTTPPPPSRGPPIRGASVLGGHPNSRPNHTPL